MSDAKQVVELTTKPDHNLTVALSHRMTALMEAAAPNVKADGNWITRTKLELLAKPDTSGLMTTKKGVETALTAIIRAATVGINFGGSKPQAYFVPTDGGIRLDVSQFGYCAVATFGPGAVLSQVPELIVVHQNDGIRIDQGTGRVIFPEGGIDPFRDRGPLVGWVMRLDFKDGRQSEVRYITLPEVQKIARDHGNTSAPSYKKDEPQMFEKIAVKQMLKRVFAEAEGRSQANLADLMDEPKYDEPPAINRDPASRMADQMKRAEAGLKPAVVDPDPVVEPEVEEVAPEPAAATTKDPDVLF